MIRSNVTAATKAAHEISGRPPQFSSLNSAAEFLLTLADRDVPGSIDHALVFVDAQGFDNASDQTSDWVQRAVAVFSSIASL
jgi:hypothetical protein